MSGSLPGMVSPGSVFDGLIWASPPALLMGSSATATPELKGPTTPRTAGSAASRRILLAPGAGLAGLRVRNTSGPLVLAEARPETADDGEDDEPDPHEWQPAPRREPVVALRHVRRQIRLVDRGGLLEAVVELVEVVVRLAVRGAGSVGDRRVALSGLQQGEKLPVVALVLLVG